METLIIAMIAAAGRQALDTGRVKPPIAVKFYNDLQQQRGWHAFVHDVLDLEMEIDVRINS